MPVPEKFKEPLLWFMNNKIQLTEIQVKEFLTEQYVEVPVFEALFYTLLLHNKELLFSTIKKNKLNDKFKRYLENPYPSSYQALPLNLRVRMKDELLDFFKDSKDEFSKQILKSINEFEME